MFDTITNEKASVIVNKWKQMVKDYKLQESEK